MSVYLLVAFDWDITCSSGSSTVQEISPRLRFFGFSIEVVVLYVSIRSLLLLTGGLRRKFNSLGNLKLKFLRPRVAKGNSLGNYCNDDISATTANQPMVWIDELLYVTRAIE
jgi:hypothetical protein